MGGVYIPTIRYDLGFPIQALMTDLAGCRIYEVDRPAKRAEMVTLVWDRCMYGTDSNAIPVDSGKRFRNVTTANMLTPSSYKLFVSSIHKTILYMYTMS